jgi:hypothetical protein
MVDTFQALLQLKVGDFAMRTSSCDVAKSTVSYRNEVLENPESRR